MGAGVWKFLFPEEPQRRRRYTGKQPPRTEAENLGRANCVGEGLPGDTSNVDATAAAAGGKRAREVDTGSTADLDEGSTPRPKRREKEMRLHEHIEQFVLGTSSSDEEPSISRREQPASEDEEWWSQVETAIAADEAFGRETTIRNLIDNDEACEATDLAGASNSDEMLPSLVRVWAKRPPAAEEEPRRKHKLRRPG
jgi:hypothetical protein